VAHSWEKAAFQVAKSFDLVPLFSGNARFWKVIHGYIQKLWLSLHESVLAWAQAMNWSSC